MIPAELLICFGSIPKVSTPPLSLFPPLFPTEPQRITEMTLMRAERPQGARHALEKMTNGKKSDHPPQTFSFEHNKVQPT